MPNYYDFGTGINIPKKPTFRGYDPYTPRTPIPRVNFTGVGGRKWNEDKFNTEPEVYSGPSMRAANWKDKIRDAIGKLDDIELPPALDMLNPLKGINEPAEDITLGMMSDLPGKGIGKGVSKKLAGKKVRGSKTVADAVKSSADDLAPFTDLPSPQDMKTLYPKTILHPAPLDAPRFDPFESITGNSPLAEATRPTIGKVLDDISNPYSWENPVQLPDKPPELGVHGPAKPDFPIRPQEPPGSTFPRKYGYDIPLQGDPRLPAHYQAQGRTGTNPAVTEALVPPRILKGPQLDLTPPTPKSKPGPFTPDNPLLEPLGPIPETHPSNPSGIPFGPKKPRNLGDIEDFIRTIEDPPNLPDLHSNPIIKVSPSNELGRVGRSTRSVTRGRGLHGQAIDNRMSAKETNAETIAGDWEYRTREILGPLAKPKNQALFETQIVPYLDDASVPIPKGHPYESQIMALRDLDDEIATAAERSNIHYIDKEGNKTSWRRREGGYFPRMYNWDNPDTVVKALVKKYGMPEAEAVAIVNRSADTGGRLLTFDQIQNGKWSKKTGEKTSSFQHAIELDLPLENRRRDVGALIIHQRDVANRIAHKKFLGEKDIAEGPLRDLMKQDSDAPGLQDILANALKRDGSTAPTRESQKFWGRLSSAGILPKMGNFIFNNPVQLALTVARSSPRATANMLADAFRKKARTRTGTRSGATTAVHNASILDADLSGKAGRVLGLPQSESAIRQIAAGAGERSAVDYFSQLKKNPNNKRAAAELEKLTMTTREELLGQTELTPLQLRYAANRMSANTQGLNRPMSKPYRWTSGDNEPAKRFFSGLKNFAYIQGDLATEAVKANPWKALGVGLPAYAALGGASSAIKDTISGTVDSAINDKPLGRTVSEKFKSRGDYLPDSFPTPVKYGLDSLSQGYASGMTGDLLKTIFSNSAEDWVNFANPLAGTAFKFSKGIAAASKGKPEGLYREIAKNIPVPIINQPVANALWPYKKKKSGLPSIPVPEGPKINFDIF